MSDLGTITHFSVLCETIQLARQLLTLGIDAATNNRTRNIQWTSLNLKLVGFLGKQGSTYGNQLEQANKIRKGRGKIITKKNPKNYTKTIVQTRERDKLKRRTGNRGAMGDMANLHKRRGARWLEIQMGREINKEQLKLIRAEQKNQSGNTDRRTATGDAQKGMIINQWGKLQTGNLEDDTDDNRCRRIQQESQRRQQQTMCQKRIWGMTALSKNQRHTCC